MRAPSRGSLAVAAVGAAIALASGLALRGFTVDDALIPARYAAHLADGAGYRWNRGGPVTDGVTPLGWAFLLAPFAGGGPLSALAAAKVLGLVAWAAAAALVALAIHRASDRPIRYLALGILASAPLAAWSVAGLETGLVAAIAGAAVGGRALGRHRLGCAAAGIAAALRPELLPWAVVVAVTPGQGAAGPGGPEAPVAPAAARGADRAEGAAAPAWWLRAALALAPFLVVVAIRSSVFGRAAPLSALAKPADAVLGARYALACFLLTGPVALIAPLAWRRLGAWPRGLVLAVAAHFVAVALAGGDWMPLSRLVVPVLPTVALAAAHVASSSAAPVAVARLAVALAGEVFAYVQAGPAAARVGPARMAVIDELRGALRPAKVIAALDIGWVGAASDATVVDLAGVTDPTVAALPGGHTSKEIPATFLDARGVDTVVLLLAPGEPLARPWTRSRFDRRVEARVAFIPNVGDDFEVAAVSEAAPLRYVVLRRVSRAVAAGAPRGP